MTSDELKEYVDALAAEFSGRILALMQVIRVLQSQPNYDHERFLAMLGTLEAAHEEATKGRPPSLTNEQRSAYDSTLQMFSTHLPPLPEEWVVRTPKSPTDL